MEEDKETNKQGTNFHQWLNLKYIENIQARNQKQQGLLAELEVGEEIKKLRTKIGLTNPQKTSNQYHAPGLDLEYT